MTLSATRRLYLSTARSVLALVSHPAVAERWAAPSALEHMTVGALAGHTTRSVVIVETFLDAEDPRSPAPVGASGYYTALDGLTDAGSPLNRGVRERSEAMAAQGFPAVTEAALACLARLSDRLPGEPEDRQVTAFGEQPMALDQYLRTRLVELVVHADDLAVSTDLPSPALEEAAHREVVEVLLGIALLRHGAPTLVRALARRERVTADVLRAL